MVDIAVASLSSSSSGGNAFAVRFGAGAHPPWVLVDAGPTRKRLVEGAEQLGLDLHDLKAVLLTHQHKDHLFGLRVFAKHMYNLTSDRLHIYCRKTMISHLSDIDKQHALILSGEDDLDIVIPDLPEVLIRRFFLDHDDVGNAGHYFSSDKSSLTIIGDCSNVPDVVIPYLAASDLIVIESNYNDRMLESGPYESSLKERVSFSGHLSNQQAALAVERSLGSSARPTAELDILHRRVSLVLLSHLSRTNNTPHTALSDFEHYCPGVHAETLPQKEVSQWYSAVGLDAASRSRAVEARLEGPPVLRSPSSLDAASRSSGAGDVLAYPSTPNTGDVMELKLATAGAKNQYLRMVLSGPSKGGKTYSSLRIAKGMVGPSKCAIMDTQSPQGLYYGREFSAEGWPYLHLPLSKPHSPQRYIQGMRLAAQNGLDFLIIDSGTHMWMNLLEHVNTSGGWKSKAGQEANNMYESFITELIALPLHVIMCLRSRTDWDKGVRFGSNPIMRNEFEFEFDVEGTIDLHHNLSMQARGGPLGSFHDRSMMCPDESLGKEFATALSTMGTDDQIPHIPAHIKDLVDLGTATGLKDKLKEHITRSLDKLVKDVTPEESKRICGQVAFLCQQDPEELKKRLDGYPEGWIGMPMDDIDNLIKDLIPKKEVA